MGERAFLSTRRCLLGTAGAALLGGCGNREGSTATRPGTSQTATSPAATTTDRPSDGETPRSSWELPTGSPRAADVEPIVLITHLDLPWEVAFTRTGELFVSQRGGGLLRFRSQAVRAAANGTPLDAREVPESDRMEWPGDGVQGIALHPEYPDSSWLYAYVTVGNNSREHNRLIRFDPTATTHEETAEVLIDEIQGGHTIGGRIAFGPAGDLWVTVGAFPEPELAQDRSSIQGSILRLKPDGSPSAANPGPTGTDPRLFSYGHRNPQGLAWLPDGTPVCTDHGPTGRDEIQRLWPGVNHGWPRARNPSEYRAHSQFTPPLVNTGPDVTWAPAGCLFYRGTEIPAWQNRLLVATLRGRHINVVTLLPPDAEQPPLDGAARRYDAAWLDDTFTATAHRILEGVLGRIRHVVHGPEGRLFAMTSNLAGAGGENDPFPKEHDDILVQLRPK